jgi:hypothetical protein
MYLCFQQVFAGVMSYTCGANCFHTTSLWFGLMWVSEHHPNKTISLVVGQVTSILCLRIDKVQGNSLDEVMNSRHLMTFCIFLGCTLSKRTFYFKDDLKFELTIAIIMACFVANFISMLDLFTSVRNWTRPERNSSLTTPCFENLKCLGTLETTIGFKSTLYIIACLVVNPRNTTSWEEMV